MESHKTVIHLFRRDLRVKDNTALHHASQQGVVLPLFIFDPKQLSSANTYRSDHALGFMIDSLQNLSEEITKQGGALSIGYGDPISVLTEILEKNSITAIYANKDYTPFAKNRDQKITHLCAKYGIPFITYDDALLYGPDDVLKADGTPYTIFTPYWKASLQKEVAKPLIYQTTFSPVIAKGAETLTAILHAHADEFPTQRSPIRGGSDNAKNTLNHISDIHHSYVEDRDTPSVDTTHLSAHLKFGTVSARTAHDSINKTLGSDHALLRQLHWRDFFTQIANHFPHVFGGAFHHKYDAIEWENNPKNIDAWKNGMTGFPIVDAGMRELNATGFMHNRTRMIVASFLTKDLHCDWRIGEQYFATKLVDYDPAVNNGNWQWAASTGCDAQPYFRIFNPWLQQKRFDPEALYIKKWVPELKNSDAESIHALSRGVRALDIDESYPQLIVDHSEASARAKEMYGKLK